MIATCWKHVRCSLAVCVALMLAAGARAEAPPVWPMAHAHNDYRHERPLADALAHGFASVEADVFLVDGELRVGHARSELRPGRTLEALYLDPLAERVRAGGGSVYGDGTQVTLLVDIKEEGPAVYRRLAEVLPRYAAMLTRVEDSKSGDRNRLEPGGQSRFSEQLEKTGTVPDGSGPGAVEVIISGDRPTKLIAGANPRYVAIDGRPADLEGSAPASLVPLVSENWFNLFAWGGYGEFPAGERAKLRKLVARAHAQQRRVRFWASPETPACWAELLDAKVDLISTDDLDGLTRFLTERDAGGRCCCVDVPMVPALLGQPTVSGISRHSAPGSAGGLP